MTQPRDYVIYTYRDTNRKGPHLPSICNLHTLISMDPNSGMRCVEVSCDYISYVPNNFQS